MALPPNCSCFCDCNCGPPVVLDTWIGLRVIDRDIDLRSFAAWRANKLDSVRKAGLLWAICLTGTGNKSAGSRWCFEQNLLGSGIVTTAPDSFGIAPTIQHIDGVVSFAPISIGTIYDGKIRTAWGAPLRRRIWMAPGPSPGPFESCDGVDHLAASGFVTALAARSPALKHDFSHPEYCTPPTLCDDIGANAVGGAADLEYSLVVLCVCCDSAASWWTRGEWSGNTNPEPCHEDSHPPVIPNDRDALRLDDYFCRDSSMITRKAWCTPDVLALNGGYDASSLDFGGTDQPTISLSNLETAYGTDFAFGGDWVQAMPNVGSALVARFDEFDLSRVNTLWLGGHSALSINPSGGLYVPNSATPYTIDSSSLQPLRDWLDTGNKLLVIDGGMLANNLVSGLGVTFSVEPTMNATTVPSVNSKPGGLYLDYIPFVKVGGTPLTVDSIAHEFTTGVSSPFGIGILGTGGACDLPTVYVPVIIPGANTTVIGQLNGEMATPPTVIANVATCPATSTAVSYPAVVVEEWSGNPSSRIVFASMCAAVFHTASSTLQWGFGLSAFGNTAFIRNLRA